MFRHRHIPQECGADGCEELSVNHNGFCNRHYLRWRRYGDPNKGRDARIAKRFYEENVSRHSDKDECLIWPYMRSEAGYGVLNWNKRPNIVSRLICSDTYGPPPSDEYQAAHSCGNGHLGCVNRWHVSWKTPQQNTDDKIIHGTKLFGEDVPVSKLTTDQVLKIRAAYTPGKTTYKQIGEQYGISREQASNIVRRKSWGWL